MYHFFMIRIVHKPHVSMRKNLQRKKCLSSLWCFPDNHKCMASHYIYICIYIYKYIYIYIYIYKVFIYDFGIGASCSHMSDYITSDKISNCKQLCCKTCEDLVLVTLVVVHSTAGRGASGYCTTAQWGKKKHSESTNLHCAYFEERETV